MLHLLLGRAGSGKTTKIREILQNIPIEQTPVLLVPEQSSFQNERAMLHLLGAKEAQRVQVLSFTRLADRAFRKYGGAAGRRLDDGGRNAFMSLALEQVKDRLDFYRKNADSIELISLLLSVETELKMCGITPFHLLETTAEEQLRLSGTLQQKTKELSLILEAYEALVAQSFIDPLDDLTRLKHLLEEHAYFKGCIVAVDAFQSFTVQEYQILSLILKQADEVYVSLCTDTLEDAEKGMGLFSLVRRTGNNLIRMAKEQDVRVAAPAVLEEGGRFQAAGIAALEKQIFRPFRRGKQPAEGVVVYEARDLYDESEFTAAMIRELVMEAGYRYHDFAVIARSLDAYRERLDAALEHREIPYFMDKPQAIDAEPLMRLVLSAFQAIRSGFATTDVFSYVKTGLTGLSVEDVSSLENYTFLWNLSGKKWKETWVEHPRGFVEEWTEQDRGSLSHLNASRAVIVEPLLRFAENAADTDGEGMAAAVYCLLEEIHAAKHLKTLASRLAAAGNTELAERQLRLWDILMQILDQSALVLKGTKLRHTRYAELLRLMILAHDVASIPEELDAVTVGAADRIRVQEPKVVFLLGAAQGDFPLTPGSSGIFSDSERRELIALGLPLNDTLEGVAVQERFLAYAAMSAASERLYLSFPAAGPEGEAKRASVIITEARSVLKQVPVDTRNSLPVSFFANAEQPAFVWAAQQWREPTPVSTALKQFFTGKEGYVPRIEALDRASQKRAASFADEKKAYELFGASMHVSATQIEKFYLCRFQYFCRFGLQAKERRTAELDALEYGSLMHYLLEHLFREQGAERIYGMEAQALKQEIDRLLYRYAESKMGGLASKTPRFAYLVSRLSESAAVIVSHIAEELCQSEFQPVDFELPIGTEEVPPLIVPLPDGGEVRVDGKVDRVDLFRKNGAPYLRVIDYKTGKKEFKLSDVIYGINMQMLIYLAALCENAGTRYGVRPGPAGILYMPASRPNLSAMRGVSPEKVAAEEGKKLRMNGLLVDDPIVIEAMEQKAEGKYIPVALKNGASAKRDSVVSPREMNAIMRHAKELVAQMAQELHRGKIAATPLNGDTDACEWCPYFAVCGHEPEDTVRPMAQWDRDAAVEELTQDAKGGDENGEA